MTDKDCLVSIIVPIYNVEKYLDQCIRSIVEQTYENLEIILVDDGSPDNCPAICDAWAAKDSRIRVIHKENGGLSDARNAGIAVATGEWIMFIDSDDAVSTPLVDALLQVTSKKDILTVAGVVRFKDELPRENGKVSIPENCGKELASYRGGMYCWGALYNRDVIQSIDLRFDISLRNVEDVVWNGEYLRFISEVQYVSTPAYYYRINPTSITSRCSDVRWQISSWIAARRSLLNWFGDKPLTQQQKREAREMFRHCQNNIYAECLAGGITFTQLCLLEKEEQKKYVCDEKLITGWERIAWRVFPRMYFGAYMLALRLRNIISKVIK